MSYRERCSICDGIAVDHCTVCGRPACSLCTNEDGVCRRCVRHGYYYTSGIDEGGEDIGSRGDGFRIGYAALRDVTNIPMLLLGIGIIIIGMLLISYASMSMVNDMLSQDRQGEGFSGTGGNGGGRGIVVVFPFPFLILVQDAGMLALVMLLMVLVPFILFFLMMRRGFRIS